MFQSNNGDKIKIDENNSEGIKKRTRGRRKRKNDRKKESKAKEIENKTTKETKERKEKHYTLKNIYGKLHSKKQ